MSNKYSSYGKGFIAKSLPPSPTEVRPGNWDPFDASELKPFTGNDPETSRRDFPAWWRNVVNELASEGISYILEDDELFSDGRMPEEDAPVLIPMLDVADPELTHEQRAENTRLNIESTKLNNHASELHTKRTLTAETALNKGLAIVNSRIPYPSHASTLFDTCTKVPGRHCYWQFRFVQAEFAKAWSNSTPKSKEQLVTELKSATDELGVFPRDALWTVITDRIRTQGIDIPPNDLLEWFVEGTTRQEFRTSVITPYQTDKMRNPDLATTWKTLSSHMVYLSEQNPSWENVTPKAPILKEAPPTAKVGANSATLDTSGAPPTTACPICGIRGLHWAKHCDSKSCNDCGLLFSSNEARQGHYRLSCPVRSKTAPPAAKKSSQSSGHKRKADKPSFQHGKKGNNKGEQRATTSEIKTIVADAISAYAASIKPDKA
jgi:hypothetical protein